MKERGAAPYLARGEGKVVQNDIMRIISPKE